MSERRLMQGFPPAAEDRATLANWRRPPFNRWAFQHVRELIPTAAVRNDPANVWTLPQDPTDLMALTFADTDGARPSIAEMLRATDTDGFLVLHRGRILTEDYRHGLEAATPHILMSVSKSVTGILAGILVGRGVLDPEAPVTDTLPEMARSAYGDATLRHLLDMTAGTAFEEDYLATDGAIVRYREATGWNPPRPADGPSDLRGFLTGLHERGAAHGEAFRYVSPNSDLLGWVIERASGQRFSDLLSEAVWRPMGAGHEAYVTVDRLGAPRTAGGLCVTLRDLARFGVLLLRDGARDGARIVPAAWIADLRHGGDLRVWAAGDYAQSFPDWPLRYRSQWYVMGEGEGPYFGLGIHGQLLYLDPGHDLVVAKVSSQPEPVDDPKDRMMLRACLAIAAHLSGYAIGH